MGKKYQSLQNLTATLMIIIRNVT